MIQILAFLIATTGLVIGIDLYNNYWEDRRYSLKGLIVGYRIRHLDRRDINYLLEHTGRFIELNNSLYINDTITGPVIGEIPGWWAVRSLICRMTCEWGNYR